MARYFFKRDDGSFVLGSNVHAQCPINSYKKEYHNANSVDYVGFRGITGLGTLNPIPVTEYRKADGSFYANITELEEATFDFFVDASGSGGEMMESVYNPQNITGDVFLRSNHTGSQAISTVTGLTTALGDKAAKGTNTDIISLAGHTVTGYTKLGSDAPAIKMKKITGTTPAVEQNANYTTGITKGKILAFNVLVEAPTGTTILPNHGIQAVAPEYFFANINAGGDLNINMLFESTEVANRPFTCLITYEE